jgi:hypothetical protein
MPLGMRISAQPPRATRPSKGRANPERPSRFRARPLLGRVARGRCEEIRVAERPSSSGADSNPNAGNGAKRFR